MKKKGLLLLLLTLVCLFFVGLTNVEAAEKLTYKKVTTIDEVNEGGRFLIVYESNSNSGVCFNSSLSSLDAANNNASVTINNGVIEADSTYAVTISGSEKNFNILTSSGYYIGNTSDNNKLLSNKTTKYTNTITIESDGSAKIVGSGGSVLRYNASSGNYRFRYFKSSTFGSQKAVYLYKEFQNTGSGDDVIATAQFENVPNGFLFVGQEGVKLSVSTNLENPIVTWESDNTSVITVDSGNLTFVNYGKATITATVEKDGKTASASAELYVYPEENTKLTIAEAKSILKNMPTSTESPVYTISGTVVEVSDHNSGRGVIKDTEGNQIVFYNVQNYNTLADKLIVGEEVTFKGPLLKTTSENRINQPTIVSKVNNKASVLNELLIDFYNTGTYTKKSNIYLTLDAVNNLKQQKVSTFAGEYILDRTTYYTKENGRDALFMADFDGTITNVNSGYATVTEANIADVQKQLPKAQLGHMVHYKYVDGEAKYDYYVSSVTDGIQEFYYTLDDLLVNDYFAGWNFDGTSYYHTVTGSEDEFFKAFLAFVAPCLESVVFSEETSNYLIAEGMKLEIQNETDYLSLRIIVNTENKGVVTDGKTLAEARIYSGNIQFAERIETELASAEIKYTDGTTTNMTGTGNEASKIGLDSSIFTATATKDSSQQQHIGLNKAGDLRFYKGGNTLTITAESKEIVYIVITVSSGSVDNLHIYANGSKVEIVDGQYQINSDSFYITTEGTGASGTIQVTSIEIYYK